MLKRLWTVRWNLAVLAVAFTAPAFAKLAKKDFAFNASNKAELLNYPSLPKLDANAAPQLKMDSEISKDWALQRIGFFELFSSTSLLKKSNVSCPKPIVVAVVDTGIDYLHPELKDSLWVNPGESGPWEPASKTTASLNNCRDKSCNGIDDDNNGYTDDVIGWDFVNEIPQAWDVHGHGTHISGIVASTAANSLVKGANCPAVKIMALKYYDASGSGVNNLQNTVKAFEYAVRMGADVINYSGGGSEPAFSERQALEEAQKKGLLIVAAAGNDGHDNKITPYFPASYPLDNIISVASIDKDGKLLPSSNFGTTVHVAAPGSQIVSSIPQGRFGRMSGTSQATAFVTGAAALLMVQQRMKGEVEYLKVKEEIIKSAKSLEGNTRHQLVQGGVLSMPDAIRLQREDFKKVGFKQSLAIVPKKSPKKFE